MKLQVGFGTNPQTFEIPAVPGKLRGAGVRTEDVTVVFALGSHRRQTSGEMKRLVGEAVYRQVRCIDGSTLPVVRPIHT